ncbi:cytochrome c oxidase subunit 3 [Crocinitomix catalasitica]|nr:cytochrome c oxidase subunit 3 [Crocinitomix catalasitica]
MKMSLGVAMVLGLAFGYLQYKGWGQLFDRGATLSDFIINHTGQYGKHYKFYHQQKEITYDNDHFYWRSDEISPELKDQMVQLCKELEAGTKSGDKKYDLTNYGKDLVLKYHGEVLSYFDRSLKINNEELDPTQAYELRYFSEAVVNGRGDFMMVGEYGVDFWIYYKGDQIEYENRKFYRNGKLLSPKLQNDLQTQKNTASSYVYAFTFVHLLHWFGGAVALIVMLIRGIGNKYTEENNLGLRLGSTYWHFLGILWIYLYLFLIYIH